MPAPGDQHTSVVNPFSEPQPRISEFTAQQIATLKNVLEKQLGPEYISARPGPSGQKVHYLSSDKCITLANEVFGFNGWSSSIQNIQVDFVDEHPQTLRISLGLSVIVRVTLRDGTYHEDLGYGHIENAKGKAAAFEKAKKEATTDALKRALRHFGNVLGNCIYDKSYVQNVTKMKVTAPKFDEKNLYRHPDYVASVEEPVDMEPFQNENNVRPKTELRVEDSFEDLIGELDVADFNIIDEGHPDEVVLTNTNETDLTSNASDGSRDQAGNNNKGDNSMNPPAGPLVRTISVGNNPPRQPQTPVQQPSEPDANSYQGAQSRGLAGGAQPPQQQFNQNLPGPERARQNAQTHATPPQPPANNNAPAGADSGVGFFSARAAKDIPVDAIQNGRIVPQAGQLFNPRLESPSLRKTPGIDHTTSKPVSRSGKHVPPPPPKHDEAQVPRSPSSSTNSNRPDQPPDRQDQ
ncbi:hypothetical protein VTK26DRAFT_9131 [Humicola hyalothermophila]